MKKMYEELETSDELKAKGYQRIKRRFQPSPDEMTVENCWAETTISLNPDVLEYFDSDSEKINAVLRREMEKSKMVDKLLEDADLVDRLREKLVA